MTFQGLDNKKIFLTGGTGFFGKSILSMLRRGMLPQTEFLILCRDPARFLSSCPEFAGMKNVRFASGDVRDFVFPQEDFDYIIHAATPAVTTLQPGEMRSIIMGGMERVLAFAKQCQAQKLMLTSSGGVYGVQPPEITHIPEEMECRPATEYGIAKLDAEKMCQDSGIYSLLPRCFAFAGPYLNLDIHFAIGNFIRNGLNGEDIIIKGDGRPYRSYLYADDLVRWLFTILERGENGRPYNVGSDYGISIADLAKEVASHFNPAPAVRVLGKAEPGTPAPRYVPSIERAKSELGLTMEYDLAASIDKMIERYSHV